MSSRGLPAGCCTGWRAQVTPLSATCVFGCDKLQVDTFTAWVLCAGVTSILQHLGIISDTTCLAGSSGGRSQLLRAPAPPAVQVPPADGRHLPAVGRLPRLPGLCGQPAAALGAAARRATGLLRPPVHSRHSSTARRAPRPPRPPWQQLARQGSAGVCCERFLLPAGAVRAHRHHQAALEARGRSCVRLRLLTPPALPARCVQGVCVWVRGCRCGCGV